MTLHDQIDLFLKSLGGILAIVGFAAGLSQYRRAQNWKRAEIILSLIDSFKENPKIQAACLMLDWDRREIHVDEKNQFLFRNEILISGLRILWLDETQKVPLDATEGESVGGNCGFKPEEALIRDCFDAFFDFFDKVNAFRRSALVELADLRYFYYWLELIRGVGVYKNNPQIQKTLDAYLKIYDFRGFLELSAEYEAKARGLFNHPRDPVSDAQRQSPPS